jgi:hypothetical protein
MAGSGASPLDDLVTQGCAQGSAFGSTLGYRPPAASRLEGGSTLTRRRLELPGEPGNPTKPIRLRASEACCIVI